MNPLSVTEMIGRVFGNRYRVEELIGLGAISAVYTAYDPVEMRWVSLKVFDEALATDEQFVGRLLAAVTEAADLKHANLVEIYDWGNDNGPYIVSELCEGGSLAALLDAGHTLTASQVLITALECTRALQYGHDQGMVHRDITPRNVLFAEDQRVRIADYGLSEVLATAPVSQAGRALENVRYASPEQARGRPVHGASDMYSLALVLNEAVSGTRPSVAETVVGTLMERAESSATLDPALGGLLAPLERCGRVEPTERPEAEELSISLLAAAEEMERPDSMPVVGLATPAAATDTALRVRGGHVVPDSEIEALEHAEEVAGEGPEVQIPAADFDNEFDMSALGALDDLAAFAGDGELQDPMSSGPDPEQPAELQLVGVDDLSEVDEAAAPSGLDNLEEAEPVFAEPAGDEAEDAGDFDVPDRAPAARSGAAAYREADDDVDERLPWWPLALLGVLVAAGVGLGGYFLYFNTSDEAATVPDLIGVPFDEVAARVDGRDWQVERLEGRMNGSEIGSVVSQSPGSGLELDDGGTLSVTVSLGNEMVEIPSDIVGLTVDQAESRLGSVGLVLGRVSEVESETLATGLVVGLNEPTTQKPTGQGVSLRVSSGPEDRIVPPEIVGLSIGDATSLLVGLRLQAVEEPTYSPDIELGTVLGVLPEVGTVVPADSAVTLLVSAGPQPVVMPDIIGLALDEAIDELEELGLIFIDTEGTPGEPVIGSLPPIGATVDVGTEVLVYLDDPDEDEEADDEADAEN